MRSSEYLRSLLRAAALLAALSAGSGVARAEEDLSALIDRRVEAAGAEAGAALAPHVGDEVFLRRVSLDLIGRIPTAGEARAFLESNDPDRRAKRIAALVASPARARHMATFWRRTWVPQADADAMEHVATELDDWIEERLTRGERLDVVVRGLLAAPARPVVGGRRGDEAPSGFLIAHELKPEILAGGAARSFLGLNLSCAQCHDHPFAPWTRDQFWEFAAFFGKPDPKRGTARPALRIEGTTRSVSARLPDGAEPKWPSRVEEETDRKVLADWIVAGDNRWFARQLVNQLWSHFMGLGLVESFDDPAADNPPANLVLLDELARDLAASGFDLDRLTIAIVSSRTYRRASAPPAGSEGTRRLFASAPVRVLTGEQLYDSLRVAAGFPIPRDDRGRERDRRERRRFAATFRSARATTDSRTLLQALALMNGGLSAEATSPDRAPIVAAAGAPFLSTADRVQSLFFAALGRPAREAELKFLIPRLERPGVDAARSTADLFWALINGVEFNTNH